MKKTGRKGILGQIRNPLVFFALSLLIIEGIIGIVATKSEMSANYQFYTVVIMAFLFLCVVASVVFITIRWPKHLYEDIASSLGNVQEMHEFINSKGFADVVHDLTCGRCTNFTKA
jgi:hypothetical protein